MSICHQSVKGQRFWNRCLIRRSRRQRAGGSAGLVSSETKKGWNSTILGLNRTALNQHVERVGPATKDN
jgi:hypothetical protein